jgi:mitogen-activated protein kinase kinase kinase
MRKSIARRDSQWPGNGWGWENSRFSGSSAGTSTFVSSASDPPPPLPAKDNAHHHHHHDLGNAAAAKSSEESLSRASADSVRAPSLRVASPDGGDGDTLSVRSSSMRARPLSRASVGSRLTTKSRDSDAASLLTVDEITAEVESRRASAIYGSDAGDDDDDEDLPSRERSSTALARYSSAPQALSEEEDEEEEEEEEGEEDDDSDEGTAEDIRAPAATREHGEPVCFLFERTDFFFQSKQVSSGSRER